MPPLPRPSSRTLTLLASLVIAAWAPATPAEEAAAPPAPAADPGTATAPPAPAAPGPAAPPAAAADLPPAPDAKRVVYLPETVKRELREELRREVLEQAEREGWAAPRQVPEWLKRLELRGDVRARYEVVVFPAGNAPGDDFVDFNAVNTGRPFDVNYLAVANERYLNVDRDRSRPRLRARLGLVADLGERFDAGLRLASGEGAAPVSTNQTLGSYTGRYALSVDRAWVRFSPVTGERAALQVDLGRFENPFFATDLVWDDDLNLDGAALRGRARLGSLAPFFSGGVFPVQSAAFAFPAELPDKLPSRDKLLFGAQVGAAWEPGPAISARVGAAWYRFHGVEGKRSGPCNTHLADVTCDTDDTRPLFAQKGNTYMTLRSPSDAALAAEAAGFVPRYQYFGLATPFQELAATARVDVTMGGSIRVGLAGEWVKNLDFSRAEIDRVALNNLGACVLSPDDDGVPPAEEVCPFEGGDEGYLGRVTLGSARQEGPWAWSASFGYRHVESDAVLDAFTDSDFGAGGANLEGTTLGASLGFAHGVVATARWMSADAIAGPPYRVDVLQVDLTARF